MKRQMLILVFGFSMLNCQNPKAENPAPAPTEIEVVGNPENKVQTARNSRDYLGIYKGILPCADCPGIETSLELAEDFTFTMLMKYKERNVEPIESKGTFRWAADGKTLLLDNTKNPPDQYLVGDGSLTKLDIDGNKIGGKIADHYVLRKLSDTGIQKLPVPQKDLSQNITGVKWKLVEMNGKPVQNEPENPLYITLDEMNAFKGFAGCNSIRGHYETRGNRIRFMRIVGTMKGCAQLQREEQFKVVLQSANNFRRDGKKLIFLEGETQIATFEAIDK